MRNRITKTVKRWEVRIKGGSLSYIRDPRNLCGSWRNFSLTVKMHPSSGDGKKLIVSNVSGNFDENGFFTLAEDIKDRMLANFKDFGYDKTSVDNPGLVELIQVNWSNGDRPRLTTLSQWARDKINHPTDVKKINDYFFYDWTIVLVDYLADLIDKEITEYRKERLAYLFQ